ncbi:hypothetical protein [Flavobacterium sp.]|uniref:hypothetical protein n=1 Tax=Flavobacterium sp. TaxID=239 RepID=UPI002627347E|nr:hypothetical protein [Flavobacterium sp.]
MKKIFLSLIFLCTSFCYAQIVFEKAYFISNDGKRTDCYIENLDWRSNPTSFTYKLNENDSDKKVETIEHVTEFGINNENIYKRFLVNMERSQTETSNLQKTKTPQWKSETIFLHLLVGGNANLYSYIDGNMTKFFFETKNSPIEQLLYIRYMAGNGANDEGISENNYFRQQLSNAVKCDNMSDSNFKKLQYNSSSLVKHFANYNACSGNGSENTSKNYNAILEGKRDSFNLKVQAGLYLGTIKASDPNDYFRMGTSANKIIYKIGLELEYVLPFNKGIWSIFVSPSYQKFDVSKDYISKINNPGFLNDQFPVHYNIKTDYSSIEVPVGIRRYFFINKSSKLSINIAYVIDVAGTGDIKITNSDGLANASATLKINSRNNPAIGAGYTHKRMSAEFRYNLERKLSSTDSWSVKYNSFGLSFGYRIL